MEDKMPAKEESTSTTNELFARLTLPVHQLSNTEMGIAINGSEITYPQLDKAVYIYLSIRILSAPDINKHADHRYSQCVSIE